MTSKYGIDRSIPYGKNPRWQTYEIWRGMNFRCTNPKATRYKDYGGRGITVCDEWAFDLGPEGFNKFLETMKIRPDVNKTLDRIDPDGNYEPGNVKWSTYLEQANNKRNKPDAGIHYFKLRDHWQVYITLFGKKVHLGVAETKEEALKIRASGQVVKDQMIDAGIYK